MSGQIADRSWALGALRLLLVWLLLGGLISQARPQPATFAVGAMLVACGESIRLWAAGHLVKSVQLVVTGPYRFVRNPLYLGRLAIFSGLCIAAPLPYDANWVVLAGGWAVFFLYYLPRKERVEPARLAEYHGETYERYRQAVPSLIPTLRPYPAAGTHNWSARQMLRNREHWMVAGLLLALVLLSSRL